MERFFSQESGRDEKPATSKLYVNNNDIGANIEEMQPIMTVSVNTPEICAGENVCLTTLVLGFVRN